MWVRLKSPGNDLLEYSTNDGVSWADIPMNASQIAAGNLAVARMPVSGTWALTGALSITGGNVGIGATTPEAKLDVLGPTSGLIFNAQDSNGYGIYLSNENTLNANYGVNANSALEVNYTGYQDGTTQFRDFAVHNGKQGAAILFVDGSAGNVGIGTSSPGVKLQIGVATFGAGYGTLIASRIGFLVGEVGDVGLSSIQSSSTYNDATYPNYGLVLINGASVTDYDVWSISNDGPAKATGGLQFIFGHNNTNIHTTAPVVTFRKDGVVLIGGKALTFGANDSFAAGFRTVCIANA